MTKMTMKYQLFFIILLTISLIVSGMYFFVRYSFERGFVHFMEERRQVFISQFVSALANEYQHTGNWNNLSNDKVLWQAIIQANLPSNYLPSPPFWVERFTGTPLQPPSAHAFWTDSMALLDGNKTPLIQPAQALEPSGLKLYPIQVESKTVGFLGVLLRAIPPDFIEHRFKLQQTRAFIIIAFVMIVISAVLAFLLAKVLVKPVQRISAASRELAKGNYKINLSIQSLNELGQLAQDMNSLAQALDKTEQSRRQWMADISHELRTPLMVMQGELEALEDGIRPLNQVAIKSLQSDVLRLNRLVDDLYELSLSYLGALTYHKCAVNPVTLLEADLKTLASKFELLNIAVQLNNRLPSQPLIYADPLRISQLFRNLLNNTLSYTASGGRLEITLSKQQGICVIQFEDTAPGVPITDMPKLFERFFRVERSRNRRYGGAGLGLAICRNIVESHQGQISAYASPLGGLGLKIELALQA